MNPTPPALVHINRVSKTFRRGSEEIHVLTELELAVMDAEFLALMGPSGSGKSTLLNLIGGLDRPDRGSVRIGADRVDQLSDRQLAAWRARHLGFVFQFYTLLPALNAERNVELPLLLTGLDKAARRVVEYAPDYVGFDCPNQWVSGAGMDTCQMYRGLSDVVVLSPDAIAATTGGGGK